MSAPASASAAPPAGADAGRLVTGPSALSGDTRRFLLLTQRIAAMEFKLRFFDSALGYAWSLARPLMLFGVLYVIFTRFVDFGSAKHYPVALLFGIVLFTFVSEAVSGSVSSVVDKENLVRKIHFPRLVVPMSVLLTAAFSLGLNLVVVVVFAALSGVAPRWGLLQLPLLLGMLVVMTAGFSMLVSALYVRMRDIRPISEVALQIAFYASPILYPLERADAALQKVVLLVNPFAVVLQQARHAMLDPSVPSAATVLGGWPRLAIPVGLCLAIFAWGFVVFNRAAPRIAEDL